MKIRSRLGPALPLALILLSAVALVWWVHTGNPPNEKKQVSTPSIELKVDGSRRLADFSNWLEHFSQANPDKRTEWVADGLKLARARRSVMEALIREDPQAALNQAVSLDVWKSLPLPLQAEVEEPFSALGDFRVLPVCAGSPEAGTRSHDVVRYAEIEGRDELESHVYGRRNGLATKENSPIQGIRLGSLAALREEVFHELLPQEVAVAESLYPVANPLPERDFHTGEALGSDPTLALAGGRIFKFKDRESLAAMEQAIEGLDEKPDPRSGAAVLFQAFPSSGESGGFDLGGATTHNESLASAWTETKKKVFMIRCDFSDYPNSSNPVVDQGTYGSLLNTTVSDRIRDFSYGKTWIEATVSSTVIRLPQTGAYYATLDAQNTSRNAQLLSDAKTAYSAANPGFVPSNYDIIGVWFVSIGMKNGNVSYAGLAGGSDLWIQNTSDAAVHVHEFGHNYGIGHSSFWIPSNSNPVDPAGTYEEYGDPFDVMGGGPVPEGVYHSEAKQRLNWLSTGQWTDATAGGSGTYRIYRIDDKNTTGVRGLRVTKGGGDYYWLSYRRLFSNNWLKAGANIVWLRSGYNRSWLIDTTPGSQPGSGDRTDGSLAIGRTYSDSTANAHITPLARGGTGSGEYLDVRVNIGPFPGNGAPTATLSGPSTITARKTCVFTASATDPNGDALAYSWDFGQGFTFDNHDSVAYSWNSGGTYTVKVVISDMKGQTTTVTKTVTVTDAITSWTARSNTSAGNFNTLVASPSKVIAAGDDYGNFKAPVATSADGVTWTSYQLGSNQHMFAGTWDGSKFLLAGDDYNSGWVGCILTSTTGDSGSWTRRVYTGSPLNGIAYGGGIYVAVGDNGTIRRSTDGTNWALVTSGTTNTLAGVAYGGGKFVAVGYASGNGSCTVLTSPDGSSWANTSSGAAGLASWQDLRYVAWANNRFLASGWYGKLRHSTDLGASFSTNRTANDDMPGLAYGNGVWFAAGLDDAGTGSVVDVDLVSSDGANWNALTTPSLDDRNAAIFFNNTFITAGDNHSIRQSGTITASANGYPVWRESFFPDHGPLSGPAEDNDGDGMANLLEYALGRSPTSPLGADGAGALPQGLMVSANPLLTDRLSLQINLPDPAPADIGYVVEVSGSLSNSWTSLATKTGTGAWAWIGGGTSRVILGTSAGGRIPVTVGDSQSAGVASKRFMRLRAFVIQ